MSILDILIIIILVFGIYRGFKYGFVRSAVSLVGSLFVFVGAYYLKNPLSVLMYENLPFHTFGGIFSGIAALNIIFYEAISYIICLIVLSAILKIIIKLTGIIDKLISATIILALPSKLIGAFLKVLEYYIYTFIILFVLASIPFFTSYFKESTVAPAILSKTPVISKMTNNVYNSIMDIYDVCLKYDGVSDKSKGNEESIRILLKYDVISEESVKKLNENGKLKINNLDEILSEKERNDKNDKIS